MEKRRWFQALRVNVAFHWEAARHADQGGRQSHRDGLKNLLILNKNSVNKSRPGPRMGLTLYKSAHLLGLRHLGKPTRRVNAKKEFRL